MNFFRKIHKTSFLQKIAKFSGISPNFDNFDIFVNFVFFQKIAQSFLKSFTRSTNSFLKTITWAFSRLTNTLLFLKLKAALFYSARSTLQTIESAFQKWKAQLFVCKTTWVWDRTLPAGFTGFFQWQNPTVQFVYEDRVKSVLKTQRFDWNRQITPKIDRRVLTNYAQKHFVRLAHLKRN